MPQRSQFTARLAEAAHGVVFKRQTTFWDVLLEGGALSPNGELWRVHFGRRIESTPPSESFSSVTFSAEHPLLVDYRGPLSDIFVRGTAPDPSRLLSDLDAAFLELSGGWRSAQRYLNSAAMAVLQSGYGMLLRAPSAWAGRVAATLGRHGLSYSALESHPRQSPTALMLLGHGFVIAQSFRVVPGPPNPGVQRTRFARR